MSLDPAPVRFFTECRVVRCAHDIGVLSVLRAPPAELAVVEWRA